MISDYAPPSGAFGRLAILCGTLAIVAGLLGASSAGGALLHRYSFDNAVTDSVGGANGTLVGTATVAGGQIELPGGAARTNYASIPISGTISGSLSLTVEAWFTMDTLQNWSKVWMFGTAGTQPALSYINFTPRMGSTGNVPKIDFDPQAPTSGNATGGELNTAGGTNAAIMATGQQYYVATVYDAGSDLMSFYINGTLADSATMGGGNVSNLGSPAQNFIGAAVNFGDPDLDGRVEELRIWNNALSAAQIQAQQAAGPGVVIPEPATAGLLLLGSIFLARRRRSCSFA